MTSEPRPEAESHDGWWQRLIADLQLQLAPGQSPEQARALYEKQLQIEKRLRMRGAEEVLNRPTSAAAGALLQIKGAAYLAALVEQWEAARRRPTKWGSLVGRVPSVKCVKAMGADAFLTVLGQHCDGVKRNILAASIGARAEFEMLMRDPAFEDSWHRSALYHLNGTDVSVRDVMQRLQDSHLFSGWQPMRHVDRIALGTWLLENLAEHTGMIRIALAASPFYPGQKDWVVYQSDAFFQFTKQWKQVASRFRTAHAPMVVPPRSYTRQDDGGYLSILGQAMAVPWERFPRAVERNTSLLAALNRLQAVPWAVDFRQLELIQAVWDRGGDVGSMPPADPLPEVERPQQAGSWRAYWQFLADRRLNTMRSRTVTAMAVASEHQHLERLYSVHFADYRGRMYARGPITPHGPDHIRTMVEFSDPALLQRDRDAPVFAWHLGGAFGVAKDRAARMRWFEQQQPMLLAVGRDPLANMSSWASASDPFDVARLAAAWADLADSPTGTTLSGIPVRLDQTCSGYGHVAALTRNSVMARLANLNGDTYEDVYLRVGARALALLEEAMVAERDEKEASLMAYVRDHWPGRSVVKAAVMPLVYGRKQFSMQQALARHFRDEILDVVTEHGHRPMAAGVLMARLLVAAARELLSGLDELASWLKEVGRRQLEQDMAPHWWTPDGLRVESYSSKTVSQALEIHAAGRKVRVECKSDEGSPLHPRRSLSTLAPDYLHSIDAAFARLVVSRWDGPLVVVHDCFATTVDREPELHQLLLATTRDFYRADPLNQLWIEAQQELDCTLPPPPGMDCEDILEIGSNPYMFG